MRAVRDRGLKFSDECTTADDEECASDGSSNYVCCSVGPETSCAQRDASQHNRSGIAYDSSTGMFSGKFVTNQCNDKYRQYGQPTAVCIEQTIPAPYAREQPSGTPVLGRAAMTVSGGVNVYSAFEGGFEEGRACTGGSCAGGLDVMSCELQLEYTCEGPVQFRLFMDSCGGHASPYHIHTDPICNYHATPSGHSSIVAISMDGAASAASRVISLELRFRALRQVRIGEYETMRPGRVPRSLGTCARRRGVRNQGRRGLSLVRVAALVGAERRPSRSQSRHGPRSISRDVDSRMLRVARLARGSGDML